jgi:hypothetical protein
MSIIVKKQYPESIMVYCDTGGEHQDNSRFLADVESYLKTSVIILKSNKYSNHFDVCEKTKYINGVNGARCTVELKKALRFKFQESDDIQYFGYTSEETDRAKRLTKAYPEINAIFPLIENGLTKRDCYDSISRIGIKPPIMYELGFNNNNCIGCVKGGAGYWNKIRKVFPEHFDRMAKIERVVGASCLKETYLDELNPKAGRHVDFDITCDFVCQSMDVNN